MSDTTSDHRGSADGGPCVHCDHGGDLHWIEAAACDCGRCPGYRVVARHPPHQWVRYTAEEAGVSLHGGPDVLQCGVCGREERVPHNPRAFQRTPDILC